MTITVSCPSCSTSFPVDPDKVPEGGVNARCSECTAVFFVEKPAQFEAPESAEPTPEQVTSVPEASVPDVETEGVADVQVSPEEAESPVGGGWDTGEEAESPVDEGWDTGEEAESPVGEGWDTGEEAESPVGEGWETGEEAASTAEVTEAPAEEEEDWVIEREPERETEVPDIEPIETVASAQQAPVEEDADAEAAEAAPAMEQAEEWEPTEEPEPEEGKVPDALAAEEAPAPQGFQFGKRDPHDKARRLARVLVSDMIMYNPERHQKALEQGSLQTDFEDEIEKSWEEYVEQVGEEIANDTSYFTDALNDILAKGEQVFHGQPGA